MKRFSDKEWSYLKEVLDNGFRAGKHHRFNEKAEKKFSELMGGGYCIAVTNGTSALHTAVLALGITSGDEVIVPPLTMGATSLCVLQAGATPVFCDVDPDTFNLDPDCLEKLITDRTKAVISVGLYGLLPDYDKILPIIKKHDIALIEDNAESILASCGGKLAGTFGEFSAFSFQASKHLTSGEGGLLYTRDRELADKARQRAVLGYPLGTAQKGHLSSKSLEDPEFIRHTCLGFNYRMPEMCAAVLLGQLERAEELVAGRKKTAELFQEALAGIDWLIPQKVPEDYEHVYWCFPVLTREKWTMEQRQRFLEIFRSHNGEGFFAAWRLNYREPVFKQVFPEVPISDYEEQCPVAESLQPRILQFKTNYWEEEQAVIQAEALRKACREF